MKALWVHDARNPDLFKAICGFVAQAIFGGPNAFAGNTAVGVFDNGRMVAGVVMHDYQPRFGTIEMSGASLSARWLSRGLMREIFDYAFDQMGCQAVVMRCDPANTRVLRGLRRYGFQRVDVPRLRGRTKAEAVMVLGDDEWAANGYHKEMRDGRKRT